MIYEYVEATINFTPVVHRITDYEIILLYWLSWSSAVFKNKPDSTFNITPDNCIDEWVVVNWAYPIKE